MAKRAPLVVGTIALASLLLGTLAVLLPADTGQGAGSAARIVTFDPAGGLRDPGQQAVSAARVQNTATRERVFWVGYSVQDGAGRWHDVPSHSVRLGAGRTSALVKKAWKVPSDPLTATGPYRVRMAVWNTRPENGGAVRLASAERAAAFRVRLFTDGFDTLDEGRWDKADQTLGRSGLDPANVDTRDGQLRLKIPARSLDGAAVRSTDGYRHGVYHARLRVPDAPGSITGFFLYEAPDYEKEIDVEIYNDDSRRVAFSTYAPHYAADGSLVKGPTNTVTKTLPFDPSAGLHDYTFSYYPNAVRFYVDGRLMQTWTDDLPESPMKVWINVWHPDWLQGERAPTDRFVRVDRAFH